MRLSIRAIPGHKGYFASRDGRIFSKKTGILREKKLNKSRYLRVTLCVSGKPIKFYVHRLIALTFHGDPGSYCALACHNDGNKWNNRSDNLRWDTDWANAMDRKRHGTDYWSSETHREKARQRARERGRLTDDDVREIRRLRFHEGQEIWEIAERYGLAGGHCWSVINGRNYRHVSDNSLDALPF